MLEKGRSSERLFSCIATFPLPTSFCEELTETKVRYRSLRSFCAHLAVLNFEMKAGASADDLGISIEKQGGLPTGVHDVSRLACEPNAKRQNTPEKRRPPEGERL